MTKEKLIEFLSKDQPDRVIEELKLLLIHQQEHYNELLMIEAKLKEYNFKALNSLDYAENLEVISGQINISILGLIDQTFERENQNTSNLSNAKAKAINTSQLNFLVKKVLNLSWRNWIVRLVLLLGVIILTDLPLKVTNLDILWFPIKPYLLIGLLITGIIVIYLQVLPRTRSKNQVMQIKSTSSTTIKGLRYFDFEDEHAFKKLERQTDINECINGLIKDSFVFGVLSGDSGCGKTSLIRAGITPALKNAQIGIIVAKLTNESPNVSISNAIRTQSGKVDLKSHEQSLLRLTEAFVKFDKEKKWVLVLDQFEQFFIHNKEYKQREKFNKELKLICKTFPQLKILISIRNDFLDKLHESLEILSFSLVARKNYFKVEKFSTQQASNILKKMAEEERMEYEEHFLTQICQEELSSKEDGLISPTDIQILAFIINGQSGGTKALTQKTFQSLGGVDGLLQRFLEEQLKVPNFYNEDQAGLKVLLALIDIEQNVRIGELSSNEIGQKLNNKRINSNLLHLLKWLEELRFITISFTTNHEPKYELAHERLILPLIHLSGQRLGEIDKANQVLERRTNEWLANEQKKRFLPTRREYYLIQKFKHQKLIKWGRNENWKKELLDKTKKKLQIQNSIYFFGALILVFGCGILQSSWYQRNYIIPNRFINITKENLNPKEQEKILLKTLEIDSKLAFDIANALDSSETKNNVLFNIVKVWTDSTKNKKGIQIPAYILSSLEQLTKKEDKTQSIKALIPLIAEAGDVNALQFILDEIEYEQDLSLKYESRFQLPPSAISIEDSLIRRAFLEKLMEFARENQDTTIHDEIVSGLILAVVNDSSTLKMREIVDLVFNKTDLEYPHFFTVQLAGRALYLGDTSLCDLILEKCENLLDKVNQLNVKIRSHLNLHQIALRRRDTIYGQKHLQQAIDLAKPIRDTNLIYEKAALALTLTEQGDTTTGLMFLKQAIRLLYDCKDPNTFSLTLFHLTNVLKEIGDKENLYALLDFVEKLTGQKTLINSWGNLAQAALQFDGENAFYELLEKIVVRSDNPERAFNQTLGQLSSDSITFDLSRFLKLVDKIEDPLSKNKILIRCIRLSQIQGDRGKTIAILRKSIETANDIPDDRNQFKQLEELTKLALSLDDDESFHFLLKAINGNESMHVPKIFYLQRLADSLMNRGKEYFLPHCLDVANAIYDINSQSQAIGDIVELIISKNDFNKLELIEKYLRKVKSNNSKSNYISRLVRSIPNIKDPNLARAYLLKAIDLNLTVSNDPKLYQAYPFREIATTAIQLGDQYAFDKVMLAINQAENGRHASITYRLIVQKMAQLGDETSMNIAFDMVCQIQSNKEQSIALNSIAKLNEEQSSTEQLLQVVYQISDPKEQSSALIQVISKITRESDTTNHITYFNQAVRIAKQIENNNDRGRNFIELFRLSKELGIEDQYFTLLNEAMEASKGAIKSYHRLNNIKDIVKEAFAIENFEILEKIEEEVIFELEDNNNQPQILELMVRSYLKLGMLKKAQELADKIHLNSSRFKAIAYLNLLKAHKYEKNFKPVTIDRW